MRNRSRIPGRRWIALTLVAGVMSCTAPDGEGVDAGEAGPASEAPLVVEVLADIEPVANKIVALAEALSEEQYAWRQGEGVPAGRGDGAAGYSWAPVGRAGRPPARAPRAADRLRASERRRPALESVR
jgi:hypothetical protein